LDDLLVVKLLFQACIGSGEVGQRDIGEVVLESVEHYGGSLGEGH
jgi:hypothetical protein